MSRNVCVACLFQVSLSQAEQVPAAAEGDLGGDREAGATSVARDLLRLSALLDRVAPSLTETQVHAERDTKHGTAKWEGTSKEKLNES
jgi:hypothetical protein